MSHRRNAISIAVFLASLGVLPAFFPRSCPALDLPPLRSEGVPQFVADVTVSLDREGHASLAVMVSIPHGALQWIRLPVGYGGGVEITIALTPRQPAREYGDSWQRRIVVSEFGSTTSLVAAVVERRTFELPPGRYELRIGVRDVNAELTSRVREDVEVPDYSKEEIGFADLEVGLRDSTGGFAPVPTRKFGANVRRLAAQVVLFDRRSGDWPRTYPLHFRIVDDAGNEVLSGVREVSLAESAVPVIIAPDSSGLFLGGYSFVVELRQGRTRFRVDRSFEVEESGPPTGREFERILEALSLIATNDEIEYLKSLRSEDQARGWEEFWRRRDPTPETSRNEAQLEFFRRVRYADQHFRTFGPGWRSDMGRVYIKYGPPDQIESRPATSQSPQLEIWYYNRPSRRFVFADRDGFGRYVLVSPLFD